MLVKDICTLHVATIDREATIQSAAAEMRARNVGTLVVVDEAQRPTGILSDRDIVVRLVADGDAAERTRVADVMTDSVVSVREMAPLDTALACMAWGVRRIPVVNDRGELSGMLSLDDILIVHSKYFHQIQRVLEKEMPTAACVTS